MGWCEVTVFELLYRACKKRLTAYERDIRLQQMKNSQREQLGVKTTANRLQQMNTCVSREG